MNVSQTPELTPLGYQSQPDHGQPDFGQAQPTHGQPGPGFPQADFAQAPHTVPMQQDAPWLYAPAPAPASAPRTKRGTTAAVIAGVAFVAILGGGAYAMLGGSPQATKVGLSAAEANPFTAPVGQDQPDITPVTDGGGERSGDTEGLFAQNPDRPSCDAQSLTKSLLADPAKSAAWASVLRIAPETIPGFVDGLTPVVLRANTAVTDHGFVDNNFTSYPAVLPAGTAVFINGFGEPTVRCFSGNPLTAGAATEDPTVTVVRPAPTVIQRNVFVDSHRGNKIVFVRNHDRDWDHRDRDHDRDWDNDKDRHDRDHDDHGKHDGDHGKDGKDDGDHGKAGNGTGTTGTGTGTTGNGGTGTTGTGTAGTGGTGSGGKGTAGNGTTGGASTPGGAAGTGGSGAGTAGTTSGKAVKSHKAGD
jgi:hypothetical protein